MFRSALPCVYAAATASASASAFLYNKQQIADSSGLIRAKSSSQSVEYIVLVYVIASCCEASKQSIVVPKGVTGLEQPDQIKKIEHDQKVTRRNAMAELGKAKQSKKTTPTNKYPADWMPTPYTELCYRGQGAVLGLMESGSGLGWL